MIRHRKSNQKVHGFNGTMSRHLVMICIFSMLFTMLFTGCGSEQKESQIEVTNVETETLAQTVNLAEEDGNSPVTMLMKSYFKALKKGNREGLAKIMVNAPDKDSLDRETEYIEDYKNIKCYSKEGIADKTYVTYVYYDVKLKGIKTLAPSMIRHYICTNEDGDVYINNGTVDGEVATWLEEVNRSEQVTELLDNVNTRMTKAASKDKKLNALIKELGGITQESVGEETATKEDGSVAETSQAPETGLEETSPAPETSLEETSPAPETDAEETTREPETSVEETKTTKAAETSAEETSKASETSAKETKAAKGYDAFAGKKTLYTVDITNVRKKASASSKLLGRLNEGKKVTALGTKDGFTAIKYGDKVGFIKSDLLVEKKPAPEITFKSRDDMVEALQNVHMRVKPSQSAKSKGTLPGGTKVTRTGYNKKWTRISYKGKTLYVATEFVTVTE